MISTATTPGQYMEDLPADRQQAMAKLRDTVRKNLAKGFQESMGYRMMGYCVPHSIYPAGYHCDPKQPLSFVGMASQKNFIALYHTALYAMPELLKWFQKEFPMHSKKKLGMGKSCLRFKKQEDIPYVLIGELIKKVSVDDWIVAYEQNMKK